MKEFKRLAVLMILVFSMSSIAFAQDRYLMTGAARFEKTKGAHALPFPVNPIDSSVLTPSDGAVTLWGREYAALLGFAIRDDLQVRGRSRSGERSVDVCVPARDASSHERGTEL
ncbi:hypothetical protein [Burkholderia ubonensis]|uniref:hypothetical protein n=1 Tax=Burkholderia ubonensis TaxID=101571 RepID=UPI002AB18F3F|nr:hypothetical protein [Burkholderia ubonensis]